MTTHDDLASLWPGRPRAGIRRKVQLNVSFSVLSIHGFAGAGGRPSMESSIRDAHFGRTSLCELAILSVVSTRYSLLIERRSA